MPYPARRGLRPRGAAAASTHSCGRSCAPRSSRCTRAVRDTDAGARATRRSCSSADVDGADTALRFFIREDASSRERYTALGRALRRPRHRGLRSPPRPGSTTRSRSTTRPGRWCGWSGWTAGRSTTTSGTSPRRRHRRAVLAGDDLARLRRAGSSRPTSRTATCSTATSWSTRPARCGWSTSTGRGSPRFAGRSAAARDRPPQLPARRADVGPVDGHVPRPGHLHRAAGARAPSRVVDPAAERREHPVLGRGLHAAVPHGGLGDHRERAGRGGRAGRGTAEAGLLLGLGCRRAAGVAADRAVARSRCEPSRRWPRRRSSPGSTCRASRRSGGSGPSRCTCRLPCRPPPADDTARRPAPANAAVPPPPATTRPGAPAPANAAMPPPPPKTRAGRPGLPWRGAAPSFAASPPGAWYAGVPGRMLGSGSLVGRDRRLDHTGPSGPDRTPAGRRDRGAAARHRRADGPRQRAGRGRRRGRRRHWPPGRAPSSRPCSRCRYCCGEGNDRAQARLLAPVPAAGSRGRGDGRRDRRRDPGRARGRRRFAPGRADRDGVPRPDGDRDGESGRHRHAVRDGRAAAGSDDRRPDRAAGDHGVH